MKGYVLNVPWKKGTDDRPLFLTKQERRDYMINNGTEVVFKFKESDYLTATATIMKKSIESNNYLYFDHSVYGERFYFIDDCISNANDRMVVELTNDLITKNITHDNLKDQLFNVERIHFNDWKYINGRYWPNTESNLLYIEENLNVKKQVIDNIQRLNKGNMNYLVVFCKGNFLNNFTPRDPVEIKPAEIEVTIDYQDIPTGVYGFVVPIIEPGMYSVTGTSFYFNYKFLLKEMEGNPDILGMIITSSIGTITYDESEQRFHGHYYHQISTETLSWGTAKWTSEESNASIFMLQYDFDEQYRRMNFTSPNSYTVDYTHSSPVKPTRTAKEIELFDVGIMLNGLSDEYSLLLMQNEPLRVEYNDSVPLYKSMCRNATGYYKDEQVSNIIEGEATELAAFTDYWKQHQNDNRGINDTLGKDIGMGLLSIGTSAATGLLYGGAQGAILAGASSSGSAISTVVTNSFTRENLKAKPNDVKANGSLVSLATTDKLGLYSYSKKPLQADIDRFNSYIQRHGMTIKGEVEYKKHLVSRTKFCYIKTLDSIANVLIETPLSNEIDALNKDLMSGIRLWVDIDSIGDHKWNYQNHYEGGDY